MIRFDAAICRNLEASLSREWLETNGLGGFASSTLCGANTRRYHGLLVAALKPPVARYVLLSKLEETLVAAEARHELSTNLYPGVTHPGGYQALEEFRLDPFPVFRWKVGDFRVEKSVCLLAGENAVLVEYRLLDGPAEGLVLEVAPLVAFRDYHATTHASDSLNGDVRMDDGVITIQPYSGLPELHFQHTAFEASQTGVWFRRFQYPREQERGLDYEEDLFQPFVLRFRLSPGQPARILTATGEPGVRDLGEALDSERARRDPSSTDLGPALRRAAPQFIASRQPGATVIAGYHWFTDWGRDTMIALPGLALALARPEMALPILPAFAAAMQDGLLPNRFTDFGEEPEYNSTDATLWFVEAAHRFDCVDRFYPALKSIVEWRVRGTKFGIRVDDDGLLTGGAPGIQLTWMDAKVNGRVITPREGKPVEIQGLWFNALCIVADCADQAGELPFARECRELSAKARASFLEKFWNAEAGCLLDVVNGDDRDASIRPNQLLALSLTYPILPFEKGRSVLEVVERELLTPYGLRTLSRRDAQYRGRCEGDQASRDGAYHQGTVWPWLLGPYVKAVLAVRGRSEETLSHCRSLLQPFQAHLLQAGIGQISEIFDGDPPHTPRGCIAQAWSVGQLLNVIAACDQPT